MDTTLEVANAFIDCDTVDNASVDTVTYEVSGCKNGLIVKGDTVIIGFRPKVARLKTFRTITIVTKDKEKIFRTIKYTFEYKVTAN